MKRQIEINRTDKRLDVAGIGLLIARHIKETEQNTKTPDCAKVLATNGGKTNGKEKR